MDGSDGVVAGRKALEFETAVRSGDGVKRIVDDIEIHVHPGVLVAVDRKHDFRFSEGLSQWLRVGQLRGVPLVIGVAHGMDVVGSTVGIEDLNGLSGHDAEHVRDITAAALIDGDGSLRRRKAAVAEPVSHVNEDVCEIAMIDDEVFGGSEFGAAIGVVGHVDLGGGGDGAFEVNRAGNGGRGGGINGGDGLGLRLLGWLVAGGESESQ